MVPMLALWGLLAAAQASDEACLEVVKKIEASMAEDKGAWVDQNFDIDTMMERALRDAPGEIKSKDGFRAGLKKGFNIGKNTSGAMGESGRYTFLRLRTVNGKKLALFRLLMDGPFNYHEYVLEANPKGGVRMVDLYVYLSGEFISQTFRRIYVAAMAGEPGVVGKLVGNQNEYALGLKKLQTMNPLIAQGKADQALKVYYSLPDSVKAEKSALILRLSAGSQVSPKESMDALEALRKAYPGDPSIPALSLDPLFLAKKYDEVISAVDELDKAVGGDPFLESFRASVYLEKGEPDKARTAAKRAIEQDKTLDVAYWTMITISLRTKNFKETVEWLNSIEKNIGVAFQDLTTIESYAEFVKSTEYTEWMKGRKK
jgi:tetratricopeptide (TPR) repeat protein